MSRRTAPRAGTLLERQKRAADRLRRRVAAEDGSLDHPYFRRLGHRLRGYREATSRAAMLRDLAHADLVWVGDFHAVEACQHEAADLVRRLAHGVRSPRPLTLGVEFVYARHQRLLDRRQAGLLDDATFLRRIRYREQWGYPWRGYRELLDAARDHDVPVVALDAPPRSGYDGLERRDDHAARRLADAVVRDPHRRWLVLFGESHLARTHLPARVRRRLGARGLACTSRVVLQNADRLYWRRLAEGGGVEGALRIDDEAWCVFNTGPLEKYEAYRQVLDRWHGDMAHEDEIDLTPAVHHVIDVLCGWLAIRPHRKRLHHRAGWSEDLVDAYPEVYSGPEAGAVLEPLLREHGRSDDEVAEARRLLERRGALYDARSNAIFLGRYLPGAAAGVGAKFLRTALTGRLFISPDDFAADPARRVYGQAYSEGIAHLAARLVDPAAAGSGLDGPRVMRPAAGAWVGVEEPTADPFVPYWLDLHRRFERSRATRPPRALLEALRASRPLRRVLARSIGRRLGATLFERVRAGRADAADLRRLFSRPLQPRSAAGTVLALLRGRRI